MVILVLYRSCERMSSIKKPCGSLQIIVITQKLRKKEGQAFLGMKKRAQYGFYSVTNHAFDRYQLRFIIIYGNVAVFFAKNRSFFN